MNIFRSTFVLASWTIISRITGFIRDILLTHFFGAGSVVDSFIIALRLPNLFRRLFAEGALSAAFVPIYGELVGTKQLDRAKKFAGSTLLYLIVAMSIFTIIMILYMPYVIKIIAPGFADDAVLFERTVMLSRIGFPYLLFISIMSLITCVLNTHYNFAAGAIAPIILNICFLIAFAAMYIGLLDIDIIYLLWAVSIAGLAQLIFVALRAYKKQILPKLHYKPDIVYGRKFLILLGPAFAASGLLQINGFIGDIIASTIGAGSISWLFYADRLVQLPIGIVGVSLSIGLLPGLTRALKQHESIEKAANLFEQAFIMALGFGLPAMLGLYFLGDKWIFFLFERGAFSAHDTAQTAKALGVFALVIPWWLLIKIMMPVYFAHGDTKLPLYITGLSIAVNLVVALSLTSYYGFVAIAIASYISAMATVIGLMAGLWFKHHWHYVPYKKLTILLAMHILTTLWLLWVNVLYDMVATLWWQGTVLVIGTLIVLLWTCIMGYYAKLFPPLTSFIKK